MITVNALNKTFGKGSATFQALKDVSMEVPEGEFVAIVGTSGSGKTTLLNLIGGLYRPTSGSVEVHGSELFRLTDKQLSRFRNETVGFVFQHFNLLDHLTCLENVVLPSYFSTTNRHGSLDTLRKRGLHLLDKMGLDSHADSYPGHLSGGQKQRVAISRALFSKPRVLLCDEPTGNLDTATGELFFQELCRLNKEEKLTTLVVTHQPYIAQKADRILHLEDGQWVHPSGDEGPMEPAAEQIEGGERS